MKNILKIGSFIIFSFLCINSLSFADLQISSSDIIVESIPENPAPFEDVTISINSYATDLNKAYIEWKQNGELVLSGTGKIAYSFQTGDVNTNTSFVVSITPQGNAKKIIKQIAIQASEIDLLWQSPSSYTPPFYKGKALPTQEADIEVIAMPNTTGFAKGGKKNMVYMWKSDYNAIQKASGYGKDTYTFKNDYLKPIEHISVNVSSTDNSYSASDSIDIPISKPLLRFYNKSPLDGVLYENSLFQETTMSEDEMTVIAEPYFLSIGNTNDFAYTWKINNQKINTPKNPTELTVRPSSRGGYATINLGIESKNKLFQSIAESLKINL